MAQIAVALDDSLAEAHQTLGNAFLALDQFEDAVRRARVCVYFRVCVCVCVCVYRCLCVRVMCVCMCVWFLCWSICDSVWCV
jgi:hypothetical protein